MSELMESLSAPFPPSRVSWRVGPTTQDKAKGKALAYIDARDVMDRLDAVVGAENWQCDYPHANGKTVCRIGIRVSGDDWVWKADGAGDTDHEAEKGALSDAFKRAAVRWGIGRYLYDVDGPWVQIEQRGKTYSIKESELGGLAALLPAAHSTLSLEDSRLVARAMIAALEKAETQAEIAEWREINLDIFPLLTRNDKLWVSKAKEIRAQEIDQSQTKEAAE